MRKLIMFNLITLDGFFEGQNREIDWHSVDDEFNDYSIEQLNLVDTILFGRVTYQMMASYWPTPAALRDDPIVAGLMNNTPKIVFSRIMQSADWQNSILIFTGGLYSAIEEECKTFEETNDSIQKGFAGTFSQLDEYLARAGNK
jgi:dihydrofolate reductase